MVHINASLFLPYTIHFAQTPSLGKSSQRRIHGTSSAKDESSKKPDLQKSDTPLESPDDNLTPFGPQPDISSPALHFAKSHNPRTLSRSEAHVPDWGRGRIFNQPSSKAGAAPPSTILEYAKAHDQLTTREVHKHTAENALQASQPATTTFIPNRTPTHKKSTSRVTWTVEPAIQGNGALSNALQAAAGKGYLTHDIHYVGTLGFPTDSLSKAKHEEISDHLESEYNTHCVLVKDEDLDRHYTHFCKTILWPVFNYQVPDSPKSKAYADHSWEFYVRVNEAFVDEIVRCYKHGDSIWIHDYHLLLVPGMLRKRLPEACIGFFLHTAFPSSEVFRVLAKRKELLEGMLGANLVAFQSNEYTRHFLQTCSRLLVVEATETGVQLDNRFVDVSSTPIGIVSDELRVARNEQDVIQWTKILEEKYRNKRVIASRDKLDNIRGIKQKLLGYELFLARHPEWREAVVLIQVATLTAGDDKDYDVAVSDIVTRINAKFSTLAHSPIVFLRQDIAFSQYLAMLTMTDVLMVTPLRDGMNLTCHEYIVCQEERGPSDKKQGPLILSEFTGSAEIFCDNELAVNPWDLRQMARAIKYALEMKFPEKRGRYNALAEIVKRYDGVKWFRKLEDQLTAAYEAHQHRDSHSVPRLPLNTLSEKYKTSSKRLFILDYEGTLTGWGPPRKAVVVSAPRVTETLSNLLSASDDNVVYIASGRTMEDLESLFKQVPDVGLIAENGCFIRPFAQASWTVLAGDLCKYSEEWKEGVLSQLNYYKERIEGSWIEERKCTVVFHYEEATDPEMASRQAGDMAHQINDSCRLPRVKAVPLEKTVVVEPRDVGKATAAQWLLNDLKDPKGVRSRSRTVASSATEDYFVGTPPRVHAGSAETPLPPSSPSPSSTTRKSPPDSQMEPSNIKQVRMDVSAVEQTSSMTVSVPSETHATSERSSQSDVVNVDFLFVAGDDREDEPVYIWANRLGKAYDPRRKEGIKNVFSVCVTMKNTEAGYTMTQGATGLLTTLQKLINHNG